MSNFDPRLSDSDIRLDLVDWLREHYDDEPDTLIVEELPVDGGAAVVDIAAINGEMDGFEIKSCRDSLSRLPHQVEKYSLVFDRMYLVTAECHFDAARHIIPKWWGILVASCRDHDLILHRKARRNRAKSAEALVQYLYKAEAIDLLNEFGIEVTVRSIKVAQAWGRLIDLLTVDEMADCVRECMLDRECWRPNLMYEDL